MIELKEYCADHDLKPKDIIEILKPVYPKYNKIVHSFAANPLCGVTLRVDAELLVTNKHGMSQQAAGKPKKDTHRLPCRMSCRMSKELHDALNTAMSECGIMTDQELLIIALHEWLMAHEFNPWHGVKIQED